MRVAEIAQPIVKRPADSGGEVRFDIIRAGGMRRVGAKHHANVESFHVHRLNHIRRRAMVLPFTPAKFLVSFFSSRAADRDVLLTAGKISSNWNWPLADLPQPLPWLCRPWAVFNKFRLEIAGAKDLSVPRRECRSRSL